MHFEMRFIIFISLLSFTTNVNAANIYEVKNISVTANTTDSTQGHDQAMLTAQDKAFDELEERLVSNKYIPKKVKVSESRISTAVDSVDVVQEQTTSTAFKGTYNITFSPYQISNIFNIAQITPAKEPEKFLVIPIIAENNQIKLWKNDWWPVWNDLNHDPIILPLGDLQDIQNLKVEDFNTHHLAGLNKIAERYSANVIVLLQAQYDETSQSLNVQLEKIKGQQKTVINYEYPSNPKLDLGDLYQAAAEDIANRLKNDKLTAENLTTVIDNEVPPPAAIAKTLPEPYAPNAPGAGFIGQKHVIDELPPPQLDAPTTAPTSQNSSKSNVSEAVVAAPDLITWQEIRKKIASIPGVALKMKSLNSGKAYITLTYNTDIESLKKLLSDKGLLVISSGTNLAIKEK